MIHPPSFGFAGSQLSHCGQVDGPRPPNSWLSSQPRENHNHSGRLLVSTGPQTVRGIPASPFSGNRTSNHVIIGIFCQVNRCRGRPGLGGAGGSTLWQLFFGVARRS